MSKNPKKILIIGLDGAPPSFIEKFTEDGTMPNLAKLKKKGAYSRMLPVPPCDTPTNWSTLMNGSWAATHGVTSFHVHYPGDPLDTFYSTTTSRVCTSEYIWDTAIREGKKCIVLNWPISWPPTNDEMVCIDGTGPISAWWRIGYGGIYANEKKDKDKDRESGITYGQEMIINLNNASGWKNVPKSFSSPKECKIPLKGKTKYSWSEIGWKIEDEEIELKNIFNYYVLIIDSKGAGYDQIIISKDKDCQNSLGILIKGQWTEWITEEFNRNELLSNNKDIWVEGKTVNGNFKFKLIELDAQADKFVLFRTDIWLTEGWAQPTELCDEFNKTIGPFREGMEIPPPVTTYLNDWETYFELLDEQVDWYVGAAKKLVQKTPNWDFMAIQIHTQDAINHVIAWEITPKSINSSDNSEYDESYWEIFKKNYATTDRMVGELVRNCADENTIVVVVSDHGAIPTFKRNWLNIPLEKAGLLIYKKNPSTGLLEIDFEKSKVIPRRTFIFVNLEGREPHGIVPPEEYDQVRQETIEVLSRVIDPETNECPFEMIVRRETGGALFGLNGDKIGDLIYFMRPGYTDADANYQQINESELKQPAVGPTLVRCAHHQYLPNAEMGPFTNSSFAVFNGPGIKEGYERNSPIWSIDIAPTLAFLLNIPSPKDADGKAVLDFLERKEVVSE